jgi:hypothetical protein
MPQATHYDAIVIGTSQGGRLLPIALKEGIFTHPTLAEGLNTLFMTLDS